MSTSDRTHDPLGIGPRLRDPDTLLRENERLRAALSDIGRCAAETLRERGVTGFDEGEDGLVYIKDAVDTALAVEAWSAVESAHPGTRRSARNECRPRNSRRSG